jgi:uncharacterized protein involved in exopolysaccharide biosynthesis
MLQLKAQIDETDRQLQSETSNIRSSVQQNTRENVRAAYNIALNEERALARRVEQLKASVLNLRSRSIQYNILQREVDTNRSLYDGLLQRYKEIGVAGGVTTNNISIVDRAEPPAMPSAPQPVLNMLVALVLGLGLGVLAAFVLEALDQAIRSPADVEASWGCRCSEPSPSFRRGSPPPKPCRMLVLRSLKRTSRCVRRCSSPPRTACPGRCW